MQPIPRRRALQVIGMVGGTLLAGCLEAPGAPYGSAPGNGENGEDGTGDDDDPETLDIADIDIETTDAGCANPDDEDIEVEPEEDTVTVHGTIIASNPCHEAILESYDVEGGEISVRIDVESTLRGDVACVECVGGIDYRVDIEVNDGDLIENVHVAHVGGAEHGFGWGSATEDPD